jgi:hypothetical protein
VFGDTPCSNLRLELDVVPATLVPRIGTPEVRLRISGTWGLGEPYVGLPPARRRLGGTYPARLTFRREGERIVVESWMVLGSQPDEDPSLPERAREGRVLLIDRSRRGRTTATEVILSSAGFQVRRVGDGAAACRVGLEEPRPQLVALTLSTGGLQTVRSLRESGLGGNEPVPVLLVVDTDGSDLGRLLAEFRASRPALKPIFLFHANREEPGYERRLVQRVVEVGFPEP